MEHYLNWQQIAVRIKNLRKDRGLNQEALAYKASQAAGINITTNNISAVESQPAMGNPHTLSFEKMLAIADALGVTVYFLIGRPDPRQADNIHKHTKEAKALRPYCENMLEICHDMRAKMIYRDIEDHYYESDHVAQYTRYLALDIPLCTFFTSREYHQQYLSSWDSNKGGLSLIPHLESNTVIYPWAAALSRFADRVMDLSEDRQKDNRKTIIEAALEELPDKPLLALQGINFGKPLFL